MTYIHDIIKIEFINLGYLPNYPYHLISDKEMFVAFIKDIDPESKHTFCFFDDYYPCPDPYVDPKDHTKDLDFTESYQNLRNNIKKIIENYLEGYIEELPDWIYSYMLNRPISSESSELDISYLYQLFDVKGVGEFTFTPEIAMLCYRTSEDWIKRQSQIQSSQYLKRVPTMFGETHVTKSKRLDEANIVFEDFIEEH